jgi:hypothetical protein
LTPAKEIDTVNEITLRQPQDWRLRTAATPKPENDMTFEGIMLTLVVIVLAAQLLFSLQIRDRIEGLTSEVKKQKG